MSPPPRRRPWIAPLLAGVVALAMVAAGIGLWRSGPDHPTDWDPRVADLAAFVEEARGLAFRHPVHVDFLDPAAYTDAVQVADGDLLDEDREELARFAGQLRAMGLAEGDIDLFEAFNQVVDAGTLALYDLREARVRVRGTDLTTGLRVTLVHELTHALQDQHFDLDPLLEGEDSTAASAMRALVEGDAVRIERRYVDEVLTVAERESYDEERGSEVAAAIEGTDAVPDVVAAFFAAPYALGEGLLAVLDARGGDEGIDAAFADPPFTEEHLFDPLTYLAGEGSVEVDLGLGDEEPVEEDAFGSTAWFLLLAERLDPFEALAAVDGWGGDRYAVLERDGRTCVRAVFAGDDRGEERRMAEALGDWAEAMPPEAGATVIEVGGRPGFDSCDPGPDADVDLTGRSTDALALPATRSHVVADALGTFDEEGARCFGDAFLGAFAFHELLLDAGEEPDEARIQQAALGAFTTCDL